MILPRTDIKKIGIVRANGLGDFVFALPAIKALRETFVHAEIVYIGKPWHDAFLSHRKELVDRVTVIPEPGIKIGIEPYCNSIYAKEFFIQQQEEAFDLVFQMHGGGQQSNPFVKLMKPRLSVGLTSPDAMPLDINVPYYLYQHEVLRYLELVAAVGALANSYEPTLKLYDRDVEELKQAGIIKVPYIVLHAGASERRRRWGVQKFKEVARYFLDQGFYIYLSGSGDEKEITGQLADISETHVKDLAGKLSLNGLAALLSGAVMMVSNDTGPLHLARALGTATVGIYWVGNLITAGPVKMGLHKVCISWRNTCPLCQKDFTKEDVSQRKDCTHDTSLVDDITVEELLENVQLLLNSVLLRQKQL
ncbi:MAG TPA: glycosyltransferase family 9 protein [Cytophagaceae bacterium]